MAAEAISYELQHARTQHAQHMFLKSIVASSVKSICKTCSTCVSVQGWDKTYCLQFLTKEFDTIHFFGDKTFEVMLLSSSLSKLCHNEFCLFISIFYCSCCLNKWMLLLDAGLQQSVPTFSACMEHYDDALHAALSDADLGIHSLLNSPIRHRGETITKSSPQTSPSATQFPARPTLSSNAPSFSSTTVHDSVFE